MTVKSPFADGGYMAKQAMQIREVPKEAEAAPKPGVMGKVTREDFFRMRRKGNGWIVETVRVAASDSSRRDIHEWDLVESTQRRLLTLAMEAERDR